MGTANTINPYDAAGAQATLNKQAATQSQELSMVNQTTPYGSLTYDQTGSNADGTPRYTATTALSAPAQRLLDQGLSNQNQEAGIEGNLLTQSNRALSSPLDLGESADESRIDQLNRTTLDPQWQQQSDQLQQSLYNRGVLPGSQAYDTATRDFGQQRDDAYNSMYLQGHATAVGDATTQRDQSLNELQALQNGTQVTNPAQSFVSTPQATVQSPNLTSLVGQYNQNQLAAQNATMGGLFGVGGALLQGGSGGIGASAAGGLTRGLGSLFGMSDRRAKTDIARVGSLDNGLPVYRFRYRAGGPVQLGLMADEVETHRPDAVVEIEGLKRVDYAKATEM